MQPYKKVIEKIHKLFVKFFWSNTVGSKSKHSVARNDLCFHKEEGGLGFRSLYSVNKVLFAKLWWTFRTTTSSL